MKIKYLLPIFILIVLIVPLITFSATPGGVTTNSQNITIPNPFNCGGSTNCTLMDLILAIFNNIVLPIAAVGVTLWIVWSGFMFIQAQGNPKAIDDAKRNLLWSLIGAGVLLGAAGIAAVVKSTIQALIVP